VLGQLLLGRWYGYLIPIYCFGIVAARLMLAIGFNVRLYQECLWMLLMPVGCCFVQWTERLFAFVQGAAQAT